jgi:hypothetical protein
VECLEALLGVETAAVNTCNSERGRPIYEGKSFSTNPVINRNHDAITKVTKKRVQRHITNPGRGLALQCISAKKHRPNCSQGPVYRNFQPWHLPHNLLYIFHVTSTCAMSNLDHRPLSYHHLYLPQYLLRHAIGPENDRKFTLKLGAKKSS